MKLTPAAAIFTTASFGLGLGTARSASVRTSGPPVFWTWTAFISEIKRFLFRDHNNWRPARRDFRGVTQGLLAAVRCGASLERLHGREVDLSNAVKRRRALRRRGNFGGDQLGLALELLN